MIEGTNLPIWAMEIDPDQAMANIRAAIRDASIEEDPEGGNTPFDLGKILSKLQDLKIDELLENPPPGTDEAIAVAKVVQFAEKPEFAKFSHIVIDTAPTGHTLRLITLPYFVSVSIDKILRFKAVIGQVAGKRKGDKVVERLHELQRQMNNAQSMLRDASRAEFVIVSIPTYLSIAESARLVQALEEENVACNHIVVNQILEENEDDERIKKFVSSKMKEQQSALERLSADPATSDLVVIESPVINMEVRGVPALQYFASLVWKA